MNIYILQILAYLNIFRFGVLMLPYLVSHNLSKRSRGRGSHKSLLKSKILNTFPINELWQHHNLVQPPSSSSLAQFRQVWVTVASQMGFCQRRGPHNQ